MKKSLTAPGRRPLLSCSIGDSCFKAGEGMVHVLKGGTYFTLSWETAGAGKLEELGKTVALSGNGGASESAVAMSVGTPALDGLGFVGGDFHTDHEWIEVSSITPRLYLFTRLLMETSLAPPIKSGSASGS
jgi:hypothetical protein